MMAKSFKMMIAVLAACAGMLAGSASAHRAVSAVSVGLEAENTLLGAWVASVEESSGFEGRNLLTRRMRKREEETVRGDEAGAPMRATVEAVPEEEGAPASGPKPQKRVEAVPEEEGAPAPGPKPPKRVEAMPEEAGAPARGPKPPKRVEAAPEEEGAPAPGPKPPKRIEAVPEDGAPAPGPMRMGGCPSIADIAVDAKDLTSLVKAFDTAQLTPVLADPDATLTVLAPVDGAFSVIPPADMENLLSNPVALTEILSLHVILGAYKASDFARMTEVETLGGAMLAVSSKEGKITFTGPEGGTKAMVTEADLMSCEGVVHKIDSLLVPGVPDSMAPGPATVEAVPEEDGAPAPGPKSKRDKVEAVPEEEGAPAPGPKSKRAHVEAVPEEGAPAAGPKSKRVKVEAVPEEEGAPAPGPKSKRVEVEAVPEEEGAPAPGRKSKRAHVEAVPEEEGAPAPEAGLGKPSRYAEEEDAPGPGTAEAVSEREEESSNCGGLGMMPCDGECDGELVPLKDGASTVCRKPDHLPDSGDTSPAPF